MSTVALLGWARVEELAEWAVGEPRSVQLVPCLVGQASRARVLADDD
jgi:hypothetical protein